MAKNKREKSGSACPTFEVVSGAVRVTDPCYDRDTWCSTEVDNLKNGTWNAHVRKFDQDEWGERCAELFVWHSDHKRLEVFGKITYEEKENDVVLETTLGGMKLIRIKADIGVDSGQAGVFDSKFFKDDNVVKGLKKGPSVCDDEPWYSYVSSKTLNAPSWGVVPYGAVSSSGFGDGSYDAVKYLDGKGKVVGIRVVFIAE